jgi:tripartite-type tricarboxylate transporter receptor subunit TctC
MPTRRNVIKGAATLPLAVAGTSLTWTYATAQQFPTRTITIIAGAPPGGLLDYSARPLAAFFSEKFPYPAVVENKVGAGGGVGWAHVARSAPDGHTLMTGISALAVIPEANRIQGLPVPYEMTDFAPIGRMFSDSAVLAVRADSPWKSIQDMMTDVKANPGKYSYASSGQFGTVHLAMEMMLQGTGLSMLHVPFRGGAPALQALLSGEVAALPTVISNVKGSWDGGAIRFIAQYGDERMAALPDVPTFVELGYKDVIYILWTGVFGPAKMPDHVQDTLRSALREFMHREDVLDRFRKGGSQIGYMDAPEFKKFLEADTERLLKVTRNIKLS